MRKVCTSVDPDAEFRRAMIYDPEDGGGVYIFLFPSMDDGPCEVDRWAEDLTEAEQVAALELGVEVAEWRIVPEPGPGSPDDRHAPIL